MLTPIKLLRDKAVVPTQQGVRRGDGGDIFQALAPERVGERSEAAALGIDEPEPAATEVGFEGAIFLDEVGNDLLLVTLHPAGHHSDEHV